MDTGTAVSNTYSLFLSIISKKISKKITKMRIKRNRGSKNKQQKGGEDGEGEARGGAEVHKRKIQSPLQS